MNKKYQFFRTYDSLLPRKHQAHFNEISCFTNDINGCGFEAWIQVQLWANKLQMMKNWNCERWNSISLKEIEIHSHTQIQMLNMTSKYWDFFPRYFIKHRQDTEVLFGSFCLLHVIKWSNAGNYIPVKMCSVGRSAHIIIIIPSHFKALLELSCSEWKRINYILPLTVNESCCKLFVSLNRVVDKKLRSVTINVKINWKFL